MALHSTPTDQLFIQGGEFTMGSENFYPEERPTRRVRVESFSIDRYPVTNAHFARFIDETGYVTVAERPIDPAQYPGAIPELCVPGSLVFRATKGPVDLRDWSQWWEWTPGISWRYPLGPESSLDDIGDHPVVHVAFEDVEAYARWAGKSLPSEAEWEYAARGGTTSRYWWGEGVGTSLANCSDCGGAQNPRAPMAVDLYKPNPFGLVGMLGGVAQWTADCWFPNYQGAPADGTARDAKGCDKRVLRGGSFRSGHDDITVVARNNYDQSVRYQLNGFRVARDLR